MNFSPTEYAFLLKRAAVAVTGAQTDAQVATGPLPADAAGLKAFYAEDVAAYLEAVTLQPAGAEDLEAAIAAVQELDPGRPLVLDALPLPEPQADPAEVIAFAARNAVLGIDLTLFRAPGLETARLIPVLAPFALLAREFKGDLSYDPGSAPTGAEASWAFVRGEDLSLRVIVLVPRNARGGDPAVLRFPASPARALPHRRPDEPCRPGAG